MVPEICSYSNIFVLRKSKGNRIDEYEVRVYEQFLSRSLPSAWAIDNSNGQGAVREGLNEKKRFLLGIARMRGWGGLPMPKFFGPLSRSAFLVNKKSLFLQKCQSIELLTVF